MDADLITFVAGMKDRQAIMDCLLRYTRGIDRHDRDLILSAYHPDAIDQHGVAEGDPVSFCDWAIGWHGDAQYRHQHIITNHRLELDGDTAHAETYYTFWGDNREGPPSLCFGRYVDRFEKRDGDWRIAHRVCINEKIGFFVAADLPKAWADAATSTGPCRRSPDDVSYQRPLTDGRVDGAAEGVARLEA